MHFERETFKCNYKHTLSHTQFQHKSAAILITNIQMEQQQQQQKPLSVEKVPEIKFRLSQLYIQILLQSICIKHYIIKDT
jgi:hypothetical protein